MPHGAMRMLDRRQDASLSNPVMIVSVVSWLLLVIMVLFLLARLTLKCIKSKRGRNLFAGDDVFAIAAALFSVGQTAAVSMECMHALGQHPQDVTPKALDLFVKAEYVSSLMYIANMGAARISICLLIRKLLPGNTARHTALFMAGLTAIWTITGMLVSAFPCGLPHPWDIYHKKCINLVHFVNYISITNIILEFGLIMIPIFVWNLRMSAVRSVSVSCAFLSRLLVIAAVAVEIPLFRKSTTSKDFPYGHWRTVLCIQIAQNLSVITACVPLINPFILSVLSGETKTDKILFECKHKTQLKNYVARKNKNLKFDSMSSQSSTVPIKEKVEDYCAPLATYGLDRSSAHLNSHHVKTIPTPAPIYTGPEPSEDFFNRSVEFPSQDPAFRSKDLQSIPKSLGQVGVLPLTDWDTDSSDDGSQRSSNSRRPNSEYVFKREKVISVPEANAMNEPEYWRRYPPPPSSGEK